MRSRDHVSQRLLESADRVLRESGIHGISVRRIALDADMSTMNVYSRFGSLSGLLDQLVAEGFEQFEATLNEFAPSNDAVADLVRFGRTYRTWVLEHPAKYRLMMTTGASEYEAGPQALEARRHLMDKIAERVVAARATRSNDSAKLTAEEAAHIVLSMLHGMLMLELDGVVLELDEPDVWAERFAAVIRFGLSQTASDAA